MKNEAIQALIKTLNGQLSQLPSVAKTMVKQYQMSATVNAIITGISLVVILTVMVVMTVKWYHLYVQCHREGRDIDDEPLDTICGYVVGIGTASSVILFIIFFTNLNHAINPIYSIITGITGH